MAEKQFKVYNRMPLYCNKDRRTSDKLYRASKIVGVNESRLCIYVKDYTIPVSIDYFKDKHPRDGGYYMLGEDGYETRVASGRFEREFAEVPKDDPILIKRAGSRLKPIHIIVPWRWLLKLREFIRRRGIVWQGSRTWRHGDGSRCS